MIYRLLIIIISIFLFSCEKNEQPYKNLNVLDNFSITDINGVDYELKTILVKHNYLLLFGFSTRCHWSLESIPQIIKIDSLFSYKVQIIGVESSIIYNKDEINELIENYNVNIPIAIRIDNTVLNYILFPDSVLAFPSFVLINSERKINYRQSGYLESTVDSILKYIN